VGYKLANNVDRYPTCLAVSVETLDGLMAAYVDAVARRYPGSQGWDRLETWIEAVLEETDRLDLARSGVKKARDAKLRHIQQGGI
jgi:hypothetical protein